MNASGSNDPNDPNDPNDNNNNQNNQQRKGKGRKKVEMVKMENANNLEVTFSKRRSGLFKKASELSTLTGAESSVIVFTPRGKVHSFGNPDFETVANRYFHQNAPSSDGTNQFIAMHKNAIMVRNNKELTELESELELARKYNQQLNNDKVKIQNLGFRPPDIDLLSYQQLEELNQSLNTFEENLQSEIKNSMNSDNANVSETNPGNFPFPPIGNPSFCFNPFSSDVPPGPSTNQFLLGGSSASSLFNNIDNDIVDVANPWESSRTPIFCSTQFPDIPINPSAQPVPTVHNLGFGFPMQSSYIDGQFNGVGASNPRENINIDPSHNLMTDSSWFSTQTQLSESMFPNLGFTGQSLYVADNPNVVVPTNLDDPSGMNRFDAGSSSRSNVGYDGNPGAPERNIQDGSRGSNYSARRGSS